MRRKRLDDKFPLAIALWISPSERCIFQDPQHPFAQLHEPCLTWMIGTPTPPGEIMDRDTTIERESSRILEMDSRFACLAESIAQGLVITDTDLKILFANARMTELTGYGKDELLGQHVPTLLLRDPAAESKHMPDRLAGRSSTYEAEHVLKDGSTAWFEVSGSPYRDVDGAVVGTIGLLRDIRERKAAEAALQNAEEQLREAQKMEAIGRFAGGVAHDFNNVLMTIRGNAEILLADTGNDDPRAADYSSILEASDRAKSLTRQLVAFSRGQVLERRVLNLTQIISNFGSMLGRVIGVDVEVVTELAADLGSVRADSTQLEQVLMNLALNARDAMPDGGLLRIRAWNVDVPNGDEFAGVPIAPGKYVAIEVEDTGVGVADDIRPYIFEPFFTTKEMGKGSGLGLATVYGIVTQTGGVIGFRSSEGDGSVFRVHLPRSDSSVEAAPVGRPATSVPHGTETILLVDDENAVRMVTKRHLQRLGYKIVEATNGKDALKTYESDPDAVDLVLSDVMMPQMTGFELATRLRESHPSTPICLMSGHAHDAGTTAEFEAPFIQKPFSRDELARKVRLAIEGAGG
ncbi:MAG TPA: PAS domain S-box protein [Longimicrobiaceae bacterium]|nr:PAS domain S-box protein [Longimicrobiaceae bacterium]